jgi:phosphoglycerate dehydrogenase-like enzyme
MKVALLDDYLGILSECVAWDPLRQVADLTFFRDHLNDEDALVARLKPFQVIVGMRERTPFPAALLGRLPNLSLLVTLGMQNKSFDLPAATELGIVVAGTGGSGSDPIELTWALILALARGITHEDHALRQGQWQVSLGSRLAGKTLGVIGLGRIGAEVARIGPAFEMRVLAWSENLTPARAAAAGATHVSKEELLRGSDIVTMHLRLSPRTERTLGAAELALLRPTALVINTARSGLIDENALVAAIREERIGGAALDVFDEEPLPLNHPLRTLPRTVVTPHIGGVTRERYSEDYTEAMDDILAFIAGEPIRVLNPAVLERPSVRLSRDAAPRG